MIVWVPVQGPYPSGLICHVWADVVTYTHYTSYRSSYQLLHVDIYITSNCMVWEFMTEFNISHRSPLQPTVDYHLSIKCILAVSVFDCVVQCTSTCHTSICIFTLRYVNVAKNKSQSSIKTTWKRSEAKEACLPTTASVQSNNKNSSIDVCSSDVVSTLTNDSRTGRKRPLELCECCLQSVVDLNTKYNNAQSNVFTLM